MKRLTDKEWITTKHFQKLNADEVLRRLWELENKLDSGELIETNLPCSKGENLYLVQYNGLISEYRVIDITEDTIYVENTAIRNLIDSFPLTALGKILFVSYAKAREEAEAKLKELRGGKE